MSDTWDEAVAAYWAAETRADLFAATARMRALGVVCPYCEAIKAPTDKTQCQCEGAKDAEIARLRAEVAALREDKARLERKVAVLGATLCRCDEAGAGWEARG